MPIDVLIEALKGMLFMSVILSLPVLAVALIIGFGVGLLQAVTSIQEQTLAFVPKLLAIVAVLFLLGPWMARTLVAYSSELIGGIARFGQL